MEVLGETNRIRVPYTRRPIESIDANCLPAFRQPSRLPTHSFTSNYIDTNALPPTLSRSPNSRRCVSLSLSVCISSCVISDGKRREMHVNRTNQDYIEEEVSRRSQINHNARGTYATKFTVFTNLFSNLATAEFPSIIDALCGRVSDRGKNMAGLLVFVKLQKTVIFTYGSRREYGV